ncbi:MAG: KUP/HAK/KT family potassium transporter, partial [bacterium]|nr:KUP/HAK/KT family potassium transporter [bacterium]
LAWIVEEPQILWAFNPWYAVMFVASVSGGMQLAILLGVIVLVITGGEAPFADLGHVGRRAIRIGWFAVVYPALLLNYLGQGAYVLSGSAVRDGNVFFSMVPDWLAIPAVLIATAAAVIASQALISGDFSLGSQAIARGMAPRLFIRHTSDQKEGQIYIPSVNWALCIGCVLLVLWFESPSRLVSAYGLAVSGVMLGTSIVMIAVSRYVWKWSWFLAIGIFGTFSIIDILFFGANMLKFLHGAFVPICIGIVLFVMMQTWRWGSAVRRAAHRAYTDGRDIAWLVDLKRRLRESNGCLHDPPRRDLKELDEVMIVMASQPVQELTDHVPITERTFQKRFHAIPRELVFLTVIREHQATIPDDERISVIHFPEHITSVLARFGFLEKPSLHPFLERIKTECKLGLQDHRCVFASGNDVFIIAEKPSERPSALDRIRLSLYQLQLWFTLDGPRSLGIDTEPGLTRVSIPIRIDCNGWRVEIPESALETSEEKIDPDTRQPSETKSVKPDEVDPNETETEPKMTKVPEKLQPPDTSELPM